MQHNTTADDLDIEWKAFRIGFVLFSALCAYQAPATLTLVVVVASVILVAFYRLSRNYAIEENGLGKKTLLRDYTFNLFIPVGMLYVISLVFVDVLHLVHSAALAALMWLLVRKVLL